jgi:hypothetical protein
MQSRNFANISIVVMIISISTLYGSTSFGASASPLWRQPKFPKRYSTPGRDMPERSVGTL